MAAGLDNKITNIIGSRIPMWVINQLTMRSVRGSLPIRDNENLTYLANKTGWVRAVSSVNLPSGSNAAKHFNASGDELAKKFVLFGGTSTFEKESYKLRKGFEETYNLFGDEEVAKYGYRPMPGIVSAKIDTQGRLGSVRAATIEFKVWDKDQLDVIDALYFKLGYSIFIEWGHTKYYKTSISTDYQSPNAEYSVDTEDTELFSINPFSEDQDTDSIRRQISENVRRSCGNYDAMLGIITNFNFSLNQDGGYDCTVKAISLGVLAESLRINNIGSLPNILKSELDDLIQFINVTNENQAKSKLDDPAISDNYPPCVRTLDGARLVNLSAYPKAKATYAYTATIEGVSYYFYKDGTYQTTGFSTSGKYDCSGANGTITIDGKKPFAGYTFNDLLKSSELVDNGKFYGSYYKSRTPITNGAGNLNSNEFMQLVSIKNEDYLALNNYKKLVPIVNGFFEDSNQYSPEKGANVTAKIDISRIARLNAVSGSAAFGQLSDQTILIEDIVGAAYAKNPITVINANNEKTFYRLIKGEGVSVLVYSGDNTNIQYFLRFFPYWQTKPLSQSQIKIKDPNQKGLTLIAKAETVSVYNNQKALDAIKNVLNNKDTVYKLLSITARPTLRIANSETSLDGATFKKFNDVVMLEFSTDVSFEDSVSFTGKDSLGKDVVQIRQLSRTFELKVAISDASLITYLETRPVEDRVSPIEEDAVVVTEPVSPPLGDQGYAPDLDVKTIVDKNAISFKSALECMLRAIQVHSLSRLAKKYNNIENLTAFNSVFKINYIGKEAQSQDISFMKKLLENGIISYEVVEKAISVSDEAGISSNVVAPYSEIFNYYVKYGFHNGLLSRKTPLTVLKDNNLQVDYSKLMTSFVVPFKQNSDLFEGANLNYPVYIPYGFFIMLLNHCCTLYEYTKGQTPKNKPVVYVDYNPWTNLCLTNDAMFSCNPYQYLIPFEGTFESYKKLFDPRVISGDSIIPESGSATPTPLFVHAKKDALSGWIPRFRHNLGQSKESYSGRIMDALVSVDYLLQVVKNHSTSDETNSVYLKSMVEETLSDMNKAFGNFNMFRFAYNDSGDCYYVTDDQFNPGHMEEVVQRSNHTEIPLFGLRSIAESLEIRTDVSTKLSNMLAVSANADVGSRATAGVDGTSFNFGDYEDRFKLNLLDTPKTSKKKENPISDSEILAAQQFNEAVSLFFSKATNSEDKTSFATNYYIDRMNVIKGSEAATRSTAMIPVSLNFSTDGITGLNMGQGFTVPEEILPYTYTLNKSGQEPTDNLRKVGFIITGLDHSIESNRWKTSIRANMYYLKDLGEFDLSKLESKISQQIAFDIVANGTVLGSADLSGIDISSGWFGIVADFLKKEEGISLKAYWDANHYRIGYGSDIIVTSTGQKIEVGADTKTTEEESRNTLAYNINKRFLPTVTDSIGTDTFEKLRDTQKAALISYAYNVGNITNSGIARLIKSGAPQETVAKAIASGPYTSSGKYTQVLFNRRQKESKLYLS